MLKEAIFILILALVAILSLSFLMVSQASAQGYDIYTDTPLPELTYLPLSDAENGSVGVLQFRNTLTIGNSPGDEVEVEDVTLETDWGPILIRHTRYPNSDRSYDSIALLDWPSGLIPDEVNLTVEEKSVGYIFFYEALLG